MVIVVTLFSVMVVSSSFAECWVAMALNQKNKTYSVATGASLSDAQKAAMEKAGMPGASIWTWRLGGYLSLAVDEADPGTYGMAGGSTQPEASQAALNMCQQMKGRRCKVVESTGCGNDSWKGTSKEAPVGVKTPPKGELISCVNCR